MAETFDIRFINTFMSDRRRLQWHRIESRNTMICPMPHPVNYMSHTLRFTAANERKENKTIFFSLPFVLHKYVDYVNAAAVM